MFVVLCLLKAVILPCLTVGGLQMVNCRLWTPSLPGILGEKPLKLNLQTPAKFNGKTCHYKLNNKQVCSKLHASTLLLIIAIISVAPRAYKWKVYKHNYNATCILYVCIVTFRKSPLQIFFI